MQSTKENMDKVRITQIIMHEIGLDVDKNNNIVDQDNGQPIHFNGKELKYNLGEKKLRIGRNDVEFDPIENTKIMSHLFSYYLDKKNEEDGTYFPVYFSVSNPDGKSSLEIKGDNTFKSKYYKNESLKYADAILRINGNEYTDLSSIDG